MSYSINEVKTRLKIALGEIYSVRMNTNYERWTEQQAKDLRDAEGAIARVQESLKSGWALKTSN